MAMGEPQPDHFKTTGIGVLGTVKEALKAARPCRLALIVVLVVAFIFISVQQASEVLRCLGEGPAHTGGIRRWRFLFCISGLVTFSLSAWYFCRVLLYFQFPDSPRDIATVKKVTLWLPRLIGVMPALGLGSAFIHSASPYAQPGSPARKILIGYGIVCFIIAALLLLFFWGRRALIHKGLPPDTKLNGVAMLPKATRIILRCAFIVSTIFFLIVLLKPVAAAQFVGTSAVIFIAAASWIVYGSLAIYAGHKFGFSVIAPALILIAIFSLWNDNHAIRYVKGGTLASATVLSNYYANWYTNMAAKYANEPRHPVIVVAAAGGGIRAAFYTSIVLGQLQDSNPAFADHVFAISGVSGGSVGATVFDCLLKSGTREGFRNDAQRILSHDFLSPVIAYMLFPDVVQQFVPWTIKSFDRARALEFAWEDGWRQEMQNSNFSQDFDWLWRGQSQYLIPALFLNGTSVERGNRMILSNVQIDNNAFLDATDIRSSLASSVDLATAADMSARFTYVSPAGLFTNGQHVVDGGYFENSGTATVSDLLDTIYETNEKMTNQADVIAIIISNDPNAAKARTGPAKPSEFLHETMSPISTLLQTREARGIYSEYDLKLRDDSTIIYSFALTNGGVPLPLGWALSQSAITNMNDQLNNPRYLKQVKTIAGLFPAK